MGSGMSGVYADTHGTRQSMSASSAAAMHQKAVSWALRMQSELPAKQRKRFNTACVVVDMETGKTYYGRNRGIKEEGEPRNPILFGDEKQSGLLPASTLNEYEVENCAEVHAVNRALNAGATIENLQMVTIHVTKNRMGELKAACENCTYAFMGRIRGNYSGWTN